MSKKFIAVAVLAIGAQALKPSLLASNVSPSTLVPLEPSRPVDDVWDEALSSFGKMNLMSSLAGYCKAQVIKRTPSFGRKTNGTNRKWRRASKSSDENASGTPVQVVAPAREPFGEMQTSTPTKDAVTAKREWMAALGERHGQILPTPPRSQPKRKSRTNSLEVELPSPVETGDDVEVVDEEQWTIWAWCRQLFRDDDIEEIDEEPRLHRQKSARNSFHDSPSSSPQKRVAGALSPGTSKAIKQWAWEFMRQDGQKRGCTTLEIKQLDDKLKLIAEAGIDPDASGLQSGDWTIHDTIVYPMEFTGSGNWRPSAVGQPLRIQDPFGHLERSRQAKRPWKEQRPPFQPKENAAPARAPARAQAPVNVGPMDGTFVHKAPIDKWQEEAQNAFMKHFQERDPITYM